MNIGTAAQKTGLPPKTIRYYEDIGLLTADRASNGYRDYSLEDVHRLRFVQSKSAGSCSPSIPTVDRASADVKAIATEKLDEIDRKIAELTGLRQMLAHLVENCHGDARPECPIIDGLSGKTGSH